MKKYSSLLAVTIWLFTQTGSNAFEPTKVNGIVTVEVDRTEPIWKVTVSNASEEVLTYEMMGKVPRGLGVELWDNGLGHIIHAGDLAKYLDIDGSPADLRKIAPKSSVTFRLDPMSTSSVDEKIFENWKRWRSGYYDCRVFFGVYASRMISVSPKK